jgi:hypothetical protein
MTDIETFALSIGLAGMALLGLVVLVHRIRFGRWTP